MVGAERKLKIVNKSAQVGFDALLANLIHIDIQFHVYVCYITPTAEAGHRRPTKVTMGKNFFG